MTGKSTNGIQGNNPLDIENLPRTVLQSIYETVTGKTESMSKTLCRNVEIYNPDIDSLLTKIYQQLELHDTRSDPVTTIVVQHENEKSVTYSSKERYDRLRVDHPEMTSEIQLKVETVIRTPGTPKDQRLAINVSIDSSLPVIAPNKSNPNEFGMPIQFFRILQREWPTVKISIDFVDFLVGKGFATIIEEWFDNLQATPSSKTSERVIERFDLIRQLFGQFGKIGLASFFLGIAFWNDANSLQLIDVFNSLGIALIIWAGFSVVQRYASNYLYRTCSARIIPSVLILNETDRRSFADLKENKPSFSLAALSLLITAIGNVIINLGSSYIYDSRQNYSASTPVVQQELPPE